MTDQEAREFVEMLAVPRPTGPPPCPICGDPHPLETRCVAPGLDDRAARVSGHPGDRFGDLPHTGLGWRTGS